MSLINNHFKTFLISLLSLTLLFSISCSNEDSTGGGGSINTYAGNWYDSSDDAKIMTINSDGSVTLIDANSNPVKITNITKKSDTNFILYYDTDTEMDIEGTTVTVSVRIQFDINFSSYNSGTIVVTSSASIGGAGGENQPSDPINIVKK
ncbi:hypothetical protein [Brachyspira sp.]|uniref:hypothetical protein n=1 Tax=Brachyspira sp. TaxID=1977261 RepID=UPI003D7E26EE